MQSTTTDAAIESAASHLLKKVEKRHKKHSKCDRCTTKSHSVDETCERRQKVSHSERYRKASKPVTTISEPCTCAHEIMEIQAGSKSPLMRSPDVNRKFSRREGVAERNEAERKLTKEAVLEMSKAGSANYQNMKT